ncbi:hypothetical protein ACJJTC_014673, partial [Scirpophaga incertulas]
MCRSVGVGEPVGEGGWGEELLDTEGRLAALVAHLAHHTRPSGLPMKVQPGRSDVDTSVILDAPIRLFNGQNIDQQSDSTIVVEVPPLPPLPPLQDMKRCSENDWFNNKSKTILKDNGAMLADRLEADGPVLELAAAGGGGSATTKHSKKSLPHKKRISRKLKRSNGSSTPQQ